MQQQIEMILEVSSPVRATGRSVRHPWLAAASVLFGIGAALVAVLGPLVTDTIVYHVSDGAVAQVVGGDVAGLLLVAPLSLIAGILVWRRHRAGPVLALGPSVYGLYMYSQLALGNDISRYDGNSERFFLLYLALFVLALAITMTAWRTVDVGALPRTRRGLDRFLGWFAIVIALFLVVGLHLPGLIDAWAVQPSGAEYLADPVVFWLVKFMDLALVVPALVTVGVGLLKGARWVERARYAMVGWIALLGSSVAGMALAMQASGDPAGSVANTIVFGVFALIAIGVAALVYEPLFAGQGTTGRARWRMVSPATRGEPAPRPGREELKRPGTSEVEDG